MARINVIEPEKVLKIGQRVEVTLSTDPEENSYTSRVEDFNSKNLILAMPMDKGYPIIPMTAEVLFARLKTSDGVYKFSCTFIDKALMPIPVLRVSRPKDMEKHQQREFVRVSAMIPVKVQLEDAKKNLLPAYPTYAKDISGGGIRIVMDQELMPGSRIHIETSQLPQVGSLNIYCEVIRSVQPVSTEKIFLVGTKFIDLPKSLQRDLIRFIFQKQRELLAKKISE